MSYSWVSLHYAIIVQACQEGMLVKSDCCIPALVGAGSPGYWGVSSLWRGAEEVRQGLGVGIQARHRLRVGIKPLTQHAHPCHGTFYSVFLGIIGRVLATCPSRGPKPSVARGLVCDPSP